MAITISGENNNDRILAADGVIDQISGINIVGLITASHINVGSNIQLGNAGIVTATTFVGNVTGNVNSTSPLLLQTGGSERFRITGNNELGIAGANYGTSGQVLTSGGSGSAVTWSAIPSQVSISNNADNRVITGGSGVNLNGESGLLFDGTKLGIGVSPATLLNVKGNETAYSGSVAVGAILQIEDTAGRVAQFIAPGSAGDAGVGTKTNHHFQIFAGNSPKVFVNVTDSSTSFYGDVNSVDTTSGGTTSRTLKVGASASSGTNSGTIIINNGGLGNSSIQFDYENSAARCKIYMYRSTNDIIFDTSNDEKLRILNSGLLRNQGTYNGSSTTTNDFPGLNINNLQGSYTANNIIGGVTSVSYTHLTLPTNREV